MNLSNVSALSINVPLEFLADKIVEIQDLRFAVTDIDTTADQRIQVVARLLKTNEPDQTYNDIEPILDRFMKKANEARQIDRSTDET